MVSGKSIRTIILGSGLIAALMAMSIAVADEPGAKPAVPPATQKAESRGNPMAFLDHFKSIVGDLKLSDDLQRKADALFDAARKDIAALEKNTDVAEARRKAHQTFEKLRADLGTLLSDEQRVEIQKKLSTLGTGVMIEKIKQKLHELKLTDEQRKNAEEVLDEAKHKLEELSAEARSGAKDIPAKVREALKEMHDKLAKILPSEHPKTTEKKD